MNKLNIFGQNFSYERIWWKKIYILETFGLGLRSAKVWNNNTIIKIIIVKRDLMDGLADSEEQASYALKTANHMHLI